MNREVNWLNIDEVLLIIIIGCVIAAFVGVIIGYILRKHLAEAKIGSAEEKAKQISSKTGAAIEVFPVEDLNMIQKKVLVSDLFVNATNVGMDGKSMIINDSFEFPPNLMVADVIYQPFETPFLRLVRSRGLKAVNGLGMLLFQAAAAFELWTGKEMPSQEIWQALEKKYKSK